MDNPEQLIRSGIDRQKLAEMFVRGLLGGTAYLVIGVALLLFGGIVKKGAPVLFKAEAPFVDFAFLTSKTETLHVFDDPTGKRREMPAGEFYRYVAEHGEAAAANEQTFSHSGGGIAGQIVGTALLTVTSIILALFFGVSAAIYLSEYSRQGRFISIVRLTILNLAGVPSIVFGLFGFSVFVLAVPVITGNPSERSLLDIPLFGSGLHLSFQGWNSSLIAGAATLACMILPVIITASEESLRAVPQGFREASLALGASRWQTIRKCVLPFALPGILTSSILAVTRVAGETAPIMFTAAVASKDDFPWQGISNPFGILSSQVQALPYHIYTLAARIPNSEYTARAQYGSVFVFLLLVAVLSAASVILRNRVRSKLKW
jgi:phosphate transport system permease protein